MNGREDYIRRKNQVQRPSINFTQRDDVRDLMKSPMGQNYGKMMDLQSQAIRSGGFDKGDPRVAELKAARRQYNRKDKYNIGNLMGYEPLDVQDIYRQNSGVLRDYARPTYKEMYPISDIVQQVAGSGGLTGMLLQNALGGSKKLGKNFFDDLRGLGSDIASAVGITGAVDDTPEEQDDYVAKTFGVYPSDVHPTYWTENWDERGDERKIPPDYPIDQGAFTSLFPFDDSRREDFIRRQNEVIPDEPLPIDSPDPQGDFPITYPQDREIGWSFRQPGGNRYWNELFGVPFDDTGRETGIASMYGQGPSWAETDRRYEDEYRDYVEKMGDMVGGPMTYEEFSRAYERMHQGKPHAGLR